MSLRTGRLKRGEWLLGAGSTLLLIDFFAVSWFSYQPRVHAIIAALGQRVSANGWNTFTVLDPLTLVVCLVGIAILLLSAIRPSPALPVVLTTLLLPVSFIQAVLMLIRVLLDPPAVHLLQVGSSNAVQVRPGGYLGVALSVVIFAGVYLSLRRDAVAEEDSPAMIETISVQNSPGQVRA
jgi:hypothetical protein